MSTALVVKDFQRYRDEPEMAVAVAAIRALAEVIKRCKATTLMGLQKELAAAAQELKTADPAISLVSGTELFLRFVTRAGAEGEHDEWLRHSFFPFLSSCSW